MEAFRYIDIFATKGIEYIFVIGFLLLFIPFWRLLNRPILEVAARVIPAIKEWFHLPDQVYYHQGHTWVMPEGNNVARVGIDDFAQKLVGKISAIKVPKLGSTLIQGDKAWTLDVDSKAIDMLSPVDGEVLDINEELLNSPQNINEDPYGKGWLMKVRIPHVSANLKSLLSGELAKRWMEQVQDNLLNRITDENLGPVYQDGGIPIAGMARSIDRERWDEIAREFFLIS